MVFKTYSLKSEISSIIYVHICVPRIFNFTNTIRFEFYQRSFLHGNIAESNHNRDHPNTTLFKLKSIRFFT